MILKQGRTKGVTLPSSARGTGILIVHKNVDISIDKVAVSRRDEAANKGNESENTEKDKVALPDNEGFLTRS
jgi:hypothetical protein